MFLIMNLDKLIFFTYDSKSYYWLKYLNQKNYEI